MSELVSTTIGLIAFGAATGIFGAGVVTGVVIALARARSLRLARHFPQAASGMHRNV